MLNKCKQCEQYDQYDVTDGSIDVEFTKCPDSFQIQQVSHDGNADCVCHQQHDNWRRKENWMWYNRFKHHQTSGQVEIQYGMQDKWSVFHLGKGVFGLILVNLLQ